MSKFTVILLRPDYLCSEPFGQDIYIALVTAKDAYDAVSQGQVEVYHADKADGVEANEIDDYALVSVFVGHHESILYGWQL